MTADAPPPSPQVEPDAVESLWMATTPSTDYPSLADHPAVDVEVDVGDKLAVDAAVVGGGITGLSAAYQLKHAGYTVAVIEANRIGTGTSGYTTAKLTSQHGLKYRTLARRFGRDHARQYARANEAAIDTVESIIDSIGVDAAFERLPAYVYTTDEDDVEALREEARVARGLGLPAEYTDSPDVPFPVIGAVRFDDQAQFHPRKYLLALAEAIDGNGSYVFERTRATDLDSGSTPVVETDQGHVQADHVVVATLFPFEDTAGYFSRMHPSRAYLLAVELADTHPPAGMFLSADSSPWTFRPVGANSAVGNGDELLIVGGQSHKPDLTGVSTTERYRRCEQFAREHFPVDSVVYRWSAHDYVPVDGVPFVGQLGPRTDNCYVGVGFAKWGMTGGTAAGTIIADLIDNGTSPWADVFDPMRFKPSSGIPFLVENATVGSRWIGDRIHSWLPSSTGADDLEPGQGTVLRKGGRPLAVHRDDDGDLHAVSAVCPHLFCLVDWNEVERTWDCPCHGSRFEANGRVKCGPATSDLPNRE